MNYRRVLLKLSGESLGGPSGKGISEEMLAAYAEEISEGCPESAKDLTVSRATRWECSLLSSILSACPWQ